jgi:hypothetical protein
MTTRNFRVNNGLEVGDIVISASANTITGGATAAPTADGQLANKKFVDDKVNLTILNTSVVVSDTGSNGAITNTADAGVVLSQTAAATTITASGAINLTAGTDVVIPANVGVTFGTGEKIEGDSTDLTVTSGGKINLTATTDVHIPNAVGLKFGDGGEHIETNNTDFTITSGGKINLATASDVHMANDKGIVFGDAGEKIEGDGTDLTITSSGLLNLSAGTDVVIPINIGLHFTDANEKIESNGTNLTITAASGVIALAPNTDVTLPNDKGLIFGDAGEKIEGDGTDLTIASSNKLNLTATTDVHIPNAVGLVFGDGGEHIETNNTDFTITSGGKINLATASDVHMANDRGIVFGDAGEKIEGDGTNLTISSSGLCTITATGNTAVTNNLTVGGNTTITGNLVVNGDTTTVSTTNTTIADNIIELNTGISASSNDAGIIIERGSTGNNAAILWDESADKFTMGTTTATAADKSGGVTVSVSTLVANLEGTVTGDVTGNADTATVGTTVTVSDNESTNENNVILFAAGAAGSGNLGVEADGNMTYNPSTGKITATGFIGALTGTADIATAVTAADESSDTSCNVLFVTAATGDLPPKTGTNLTFNSSSGVLTATGFAGALTGDVTGNADTATVATTVTITDNENTNENNPIVFVAGGDLDGGNLGLESDGTATYNPSTGKITATGFIGSLTGTASAAQYSDVAERFASDSNYEEGTVVTLGGAEEITITTEEASDDVFGVVSSVEQAAFKMNSDAGSDSTHPYIAMTGRVWVKITGVVNKGDRLISSATPGHARAATKAECTAFNVLGRALEFSDTGRVKAAVRVSH